MSSMSGYHTNASAKTHSEELNEKGVIFVSYELANEHPGPNSPAEAGLRGQVAPQAGRDHSGDPEEHMNETWNGN
jgi:hypothetical protein